MWTDDSTGSKQFTTGTNKYSTNQHNNNKHLDDNTQMAKQLSYKLRRSEKDAGTAPILNEDSILQVFRGTPNTSGRRNFLLESFNTLPLPFPVNLVKPWKSSTSNNREGKRSGKQIMWGNNGTQPLTATTNNNNGNNSTTKSGKSSGTEIHIFYSYRNPHEGSKKPSSSNGAGNLPVQTTTVSRSKETKEQQQQQTGQSIPEIFTMRSSDLLMSRNSTTSTPQPPTTTFAPAPASVNLHLDYRYQGSGKQGNRNAVRTMITSSTSTTPAPVPLYYQSLYTNYSHYDELFGQVKRPASTSTSTTIFTTTTTTPSPVKEKALMNNDEMIPRALDIVEEVADAVSPKHNFISYSAPISESGRPKGAIPSICDPSLNCKLPKCFCPGTKAPCKSELFITYLSFRKMHKSFLILIFLFPLFCFAIHPLSQMASSALKRRR